MTTVYKPIYINTTTGIPTSIPAGAILEIGGTTSPTFTVNGLGVLLADGSTSSGGAATTINLQTAYDNTTDVNGAASVQLAVGKDFIIYDSNNNNIYFKIDSTTGAVTISGDLIVPGTYNQVNTNVIESDHWKISPASPSTSAVLIEPDLGVIPTVNLIEARLTYGAAPVFHIDYMGGTNVSTLTVTNNIVVGGLVDGVDVASLNTQFQAHIFVSADKHQALEINITPNSLTPFGVPGTDTTVQTVLEFLSDSINTNNGSIASLDSRTTTLESEVAGLVSNATGYTFYVTSPLDVWAVNHNKNSTNFVYVIFDSNGEQFMPDRALITDPNTFSLFFTTPVTGRVNMMFYTDSNPNNV